MKILILFFATGFYFEVFAQNDSLSVLFYNVENLFDTIDDTLKNDNEFLPKSKKKWTNTKWNQKTIKISKVIAGNNYPQIIGLCEVENKIVLEKLKNHYIFKSKKYAMIHFESPDYRGIDCAMLYQPDKVDLLSMKPNNVDLNGRKTRDILSATFAYLTDTFSIFVNHWPSRYGGRKKSNSRRKIASNVLMLLMDSTKNQHPNHKIIAMGDFNDEPKDSSLQALNKYSNRSSELLGTIKYKGKWQVFDQFICSKNFAYNLAVYNPDFLLEEDKTYGGKKPFRTYYGPFFNGGFSDHLPVKLTFFVP
jgi:predicted extracellular nuclease